MAPSLNDLPDKILASITDNCHTKELLSLARSSKRLSQIALAKLYRHLYYRHIGRRRSDLDQLFDTDGLDISDSDSLHSGSETQVTECSWRCGLCPRNCSDAVFNDEEIQPPSTLVVDLSRFSETISQFPDLLNSIRSLRLDLQGPNGWNNSDDWR
jgi:hypothetical protein